jgi:hypothetical protein
MKKCLVDLSSFVLEGPTCISGENRFGRCAKTFTNSRCCREKWLGRGSWSSRITASRGWVTRTCDSVMGGVTAFML